MSSQQLGLPASGRREAELQNVSVGSLVKSPYQPRRRALGKREIADLMQSMAAVGQTTPIAVSPAADGRLYVHQGERRWRAAELLSWGSLKALVYAELPELEARALALADNLGREDLTAWEQANALSGFCAVAELSVEQAAERLGVSRATAYRLHGYCHVGLTTAPSVDE